MCCSVLHVECGSQCGRAGREKLVYVFGKSRSMRVRGRNQYMFGKECSIYLVGGDWRLGGIALYCVAVCCSVLRCVAVCFV